MRFASTFIYATKDETAVAIGGAFVRCDECARSGWESERPESQREGTGTVPNADRYVKVRTVCIT